MYELKICRICLKYDVRLHQISGSEVQDVYEKLTNKIQDDGELYFACYICYCQLKNCQRLVTKLQRSEELLHHITIKSELHLRPVSFLDRLTHGLVHSLAATNIQSLQIPEYNEFIKTEMQDDSDTVEKMFEYGSDVEGALPVQKPKLGEKCNLSQFKVNSTETEKISISATKAKTIAYKNKSSQLLCDGNNKQVLVKNDKKIYVCDDGGKACDSKALITHISGHKPVRIKQNKAYINRHISKFVGIMTVHDSLKKEFKCLYCNYISERRDNLKNHIRTHEGEKLFQCQYCSYTCTQNSHLKDHIKTHTGEKPFKCEYCSYTCAVNSSLKNHIRSHTGEKPFKCQYCSYTCTVNSHLRDHIKTHTGEKPFKCEYCSYTCTVNSSLKNHIRTHTGEKPFKCQYCSYTCTQSSTLKKHIKTHTGEKPFKCQYCSYSCTVNSHLKNHIRTHTCEKPFKCEYCSYTCTVNSNLKNHIRTHTGEKPFQCQYCSYTCTVNGSLKRHIRTHTGKKPFKCQYCSYTCAENSNLKVHIRIHTGEKPYICEICDKKFRVSSVLKQHLRVHMDNNSR